MDVYAALNEFATTLEPKINLFLTEVLPSVRLLAAAIMFVFVGYQVMKSFMGDGEKLGMMALVRPSLILATLVLYIPLVELLAEKPVELVNDIITEGTNSIGGAAPGTLHQRFGQKMMYTQNTGGVDGGGINDIVQVHPFLEFIHLIVFFIAAMAGGYILFRQLLVKTIYVMIGPFVIAFSLIVGNERAIVNWYQGLLSILLWLPILSIIQTIIILLPLETTELTGSDIVFTIAFQVVMIFMVFKVPRYANMLVTQGADMGSQAGNTIVGQIKSGPQTWWQNRQMMKSMKPGK